MSEAASRGPVRILVVDDTPMNVKLLEGVLSGHGYAVSTAPSGPMALERVREDRPDLVLLDVVMPELGGVQAWNQIEELRPGLRVLFATGHGENIYRRHLPPNSVVLDKPFRPEELLRRVRQALDRTVQG